MSVKQIIVMRKDLKMTKGKLIAQGSHASLGVILKMMHTEKSLRWDKDEQCNVYDETKVLHIKHGDRLDQWINGIFTKVCLYVESEKELTDIYDQAIAAGLPAVLIEDNGLTMFHGVKTKTCIAIGPCEEEKLSPITGHLKLL